jgi:hypothetical protein
MERIYQIVASQGQGAIEGEFLTAFEAKREYIDSIGTASVGMLKDGILLTFEQICEEFDLDPEIVDRICSLRMEINSLYSLCFNR